jgi:hypothetical protein
MNSKGCPLQGTKFGYCSGCAQEQTCAFLLILKKLEDIEKKLTLFLSRWLNYEMAQGYLETS